MKNEANALVTTEGSSVYFADLGTTLPENLAEPAIAFNDVGFIGDEDGIEEELERETSEITQDGAVFRTHMKAGKTVFKFTGTESNPHVKALRHPASVITTDPITGITKITNQEKVKRNEKTWIVDTFDGDVQTRKTYSRAEVTEVETLAYKLGEQVVYGFTVTSYGSVTELTNNDGMSVAP